MPRSRGRDRGHGALQGFLRKERLPGASNRAGPALSMEPARPSGGACAYRRVIRFRVVRLRSCRPRIPYIHRYRVREDAAEPDREKNRAAAWKAPFRSHGLITFTLMPETAGGHARMDAVTGVRVAPPGFGAREAIPLKSLEAATARSVRE